MDSSLQPSIIRMQDITHMGPTEVIEMDNIIDTFATEDNFVAEDSLIIAGK